MLRIFIYTPSNIDDAFKAAAKQSLTEAGWNPIAEYDGPLQTMICSGSDRSSCNADADGNWAVLAQR